MSAFAPQLGTFAPAVEYLVDAAQRSVLFWDAMRQRGNQYRQHLTEAVPHVLDYEVELVLSGKLNFILFKEDLRFASLEIETIGQFLAGLVHRILDFHSVDL